MRRKLLSLSLALAMVLSGCGSRSERGRDPHNYEADAVVHQNGVVKDEQGWSVGYGLELSCQAAIDQLKAEQVNLRDIGSVDYELITHIFNSYPHTKDQDRTAKQADYSCAYSDPQRGSYYYKLQYTDDPNGIYKVEGEIGYCENKLPWRGITYPVLTIRSKSKNSIAINSVCINMDWFPSQDEVIEAIVTHLYGPEGAKAIIGLYEAEPGEELSFDLNGHTYKCVASIKSKDNGYLPQTWTIWNNLIPDVDCTDVILNSAQQALDLAGPKISGGPFGVAPEKVAKIKNMFYHPAPEPEQDDEAAEETATPEQDKETPKPKQSNVPQQTQRKHEEAKNFYAFCKYKVLDSYYYIVGTYTDGRPIANVERAELQAKRGEPVNEGTMFSYWLAWMQTANGDLLDISVSGGATAGYVYDDADLNGSTLGALKEQQSDLFSKFFLGSNLVGFGNEYSGAAGFEYICPIFEDYSPNDVQKRSAYTVKVNSTIQYIYHAMSFRGSIRSSINMAESTYRLSAPKTLWAIA